MSAPLKKNHKYMTEKLNVLLIGPHDVGKTQMVRDKVAHQKLKLKYYSCGTLDPYIDLVGIPFPVILQNLAGGTPNHRRRHTGQH